mgnify:CR=1 FL=1
MLFDIKSASTSVPYNRRVVSATGSVLVTDDIVAANTLASAMTLTLPVISTIPGYKQVVFVDEGGNASVNNITIAAGAGDTILGGTSVIISGDYNAYRVYNDGVSKWFIF